MRRCPICQAPLDGLRADAVYCSTTHRVEAWRIRRLLQGVPTAGYPTLEARMVAYGSRRRPSRNTGVEKERKIAGDKSKRPGGADTPRARQQEVKS